MKSRTEKLKDELKNSREQRKKRKKNEQTQEKLPEWKDVDFQMDECPLSAQYSELKWSHYGTR